MVLLGTKKEEDMSALSSSAERSQDALIQPVTDKNPQKSSWTDTAVRVGKLIGLVLK